MPFTPVIVPCLPPYLPPPPCERRPLFVLLGVEGTGYPVSCWMNGGRNRNGTVINRHRFSLSSSGPPNNSCLHRGSKRAKNPRRRDLRGQLRAVRCSGHSHDRHTTEERGRGSRRLRRVRRLHTSGLPRCCYPGPHPRRLPDVLMAGARGGRRPTATEGTFTIYEERTWGLGTHAKPESEECNAAASWNILYTWSFH